MRALILAAGVGYRLGGGGSQSPKSLLRFDGKSLLQRHIGILASCGVEEVVVGVGYRAEEITAEIERIESLIPVDTVHNPDYREGNVVTLWHLREYLSRDEPVLLMDADVLYDRRLLSRLVESTHALAFAIDRDFEPGEEPVKLCVRDGRPVEFRKHVAPDLEHDYQGESVGFFRLDAGVARDVAERTDGYVRAGRRDEFYEEVLRDVVLDDTSEQCGIEDITGLPWIEIDFHEDVHRAHREVVPRLEDEERPAPALKAAVGD